MQRAKGMGPPGPVSATMLKYAAWRCVLADSSKIGRTATVRYATFAEVDLFITDDGVSAQQLLRLREAIKEVKVVGGAGTRSGAKN